MDLHGHRFSQAGLHSVPLVGDALRIPPPNREAESFPYHSSLENGMVARP